MEFDLNKILINLKPKMEIPRGFDFLREYDKNYNSIFDFDEIEQIKNDLLDSDKTDGIENKFSSNDLTNFYDKFKKLNPYLDLNQVKGQIEDWLKFLSLGKIDILTKMRKNPNYEELSLEQKQYAEVFLQLDNTSDECDYYDFIDFAKITNPQNFDRIKYLLQLKIANNNLYPSGIENLLKCDVEKQEKVLNIISENNINTNRIAGIIKLCDVYEYLPENILKNNSNFIVCSNEDGAIGYKLNTDSNESYKYKADKGLVEVEILDSNTGEKIIKNLELNTVQTVLINNDDIVLQEIIKHYDNLEYDEKNNTWKEGNLLETRILLREDSNTINPTVKVIDACGNERILQKVERLEDNTLVVTKNLVSADGTTTSVDYKSKPENSTTMSSIIKDKDGNILLKKEISIKKISENKFEHNIDNTKYEVYFEDSKLTISDITNDKIIVIDTDEKFITEGRNFILEILERVPANLLIALNKYTINSISLDVDNSSNYSNNARWKVDKKFIELGKYFSIEQEIESEKTENVAEYMLPVFLHEFGHFLDDDINGESISKNKELKTIFKEELKNFLNKSTGEQQKYIDYFISIAKYGEERSAQERVAETTMLLNTMPNDYFSTRALYLQENFPRTIAKINELINQKLYYN
ncbi:MAG: hypothetical protein MJ237_07800 [bacterium]|nr:hypothetical protein [bacterium]